MRARFNELIKILKYKSIKIGKNKKILDVGAGKGFFARQLFDKFTLKIYLNEYKKVLSKKNIYKYKCKKINLNYTLNLECVF
jgi:ubiquinone/menaquinone biosynthesis C-methylase UbiE